MCIRDRQEPEEGWLKGCYGHVLGYMFPEKQKDEGITPMPTVRGRLFFLQLLKALYLLSLIHI